MKKFFKKPNLKSFGTRGRIILLILVIFLLVLTPLVHSGINSILNRYLEAHVADHASVLSDSINEKFDKYFIQIEKEADLISAACLQDDTDNSFFEDTDQANYVHQYVKKYLRSGTVSGESVNYFAISDMAKKNNEALYQDYRGLLESTRGDKAISFSSLNQSIVLSVPVFDPVNRETVRGVLYHRFNRSASEEVFKLECFDGEGRVMVLDENDNIIVPSENGLNEDKRFIQDKYIQKYINKLDNKLISSNHAAVYDPVPTENLFLFESDKKYSGDEVRIFGYVPYSAVTNGVNRVVTMVTVIFTIFVFIIFAGILYVYFAQRRVQESDELREAKLEADKANEAKSNFLANMSHEIRTPLNAILGMDEMIIREYDEPKIREYAYNIKSSGQTLLSLINDILDFSKIEAGKLSIINAEYSLSSLINDIINVTESRAKDKGLDFVTDIDETMPDVLFGDNIRIRQCAINILTNAVKYTEIGKVTLTVKAESADEGFINLTIDVKDTGIGMKKEELDKLYSPFERMDEKRNRTIEGTGLGMSITKRLLALMDSELSVQSEYGKGSDFSFTIRQKIIDKSPVGNIVEKYHRFAAEKPKYRDKFTAKDARILIVDDTEMNLEVMKGLLKNTLIKIDTALSGNKSLILVRQYKYDIIFLDHRMPGMDGIETLNAMKTLASNLNLDTPVIALTANAITGAREMYLKCGFMDYLSKPVDGDKLEDMIAKYLPAEKMKKLEDSDSEGTNSTKVEEQKLDFSDIEGLDIDTGIKNCGGEEFFENILKVFYTSIDDKADEIEKFYDNSDYKNYTIKVHALKSSARLIGAMELSENAKALEEAGDNENISMIEDETPKLLSDYRAYKDKLSVHFNALDSSDDSSKEEISKDELLEFMSGLKGMAEDFDFDGLDEEMEELSNYRVPEQYKETVSKLKNAVSEVNHDEILKLLSEIEGIA